MSVSSAAKDTAQTLAKSSPHYLILLAVVGSFLFYMERADSREIDKLKREVLIDDQRIDQCHEVQSRGIEVMDRLNTTLGKQAATLENLQVEVTRLTTVVDRLIARCD